MKKTILAIFAVLWGISGQAQQLIFQTPETIALRQIKDPAVLQAKLKELGAANTDKDYYTLYTYYQMVDRNLTDSVAAVAMGKFPKGMVAVNRASRTLLSKDMAEVESTIENMRKEFPDQDMSRYYIRAAKAFLDNRNAKSALKYLDYTTGELRSQAYSLIGQEVLRIDAGAVLDFMTKEIAKPNLSERERLQLYYFQSNAFSAKRDYIQAFEAMKKFYDNSPRKTPQLEAEYYTLMSKTGRSAEALPFLEKAVLQKAGGPGTKNELRAAYQKVNPDKNADTYIAALDRKVQQGNQDKIAEKMIKEKAPMFSVVDANGKKVTLADFKGKTIVLDFWATWCGPCKMSFPGMKAAVNKYKNDPNVAFLFIHTWEKRKNAKDDPTAAAKQYFAENDYGVFPLYMDLEDKNKVNPAVTAFNVKGIPAKFVIDGNGDIRFKTEGSGIDIDYIVSEITAMVELSRLDKAK